MKRLITVLVILIVPAILTAQETSVVRTATLKIYNIHVNLNGEVVPWDKTFEITLTDGLESQVILFGKDGLEYGTRFTYKKGKNRTLYNVTSGVYSGNENNSQGIFITRYLFNKQESE